MGKKESKKRSIFKKKLDKKESSKAFQKKIKASPSKDSKTVRSSMVKRKL